MKTLQEFRKMCLEYIDENGYNRRFPPSHHVVKNIVDKFGCYMESFTDEECRILSGYDPLSQLKAFQIKLDDFINPGYGDVDDTVLIINETSNVIGLFRFANQAMLFKELSTCNGLLKALYALFSQEVKGKYTAFFGGIVLPDIKRADLIESNFPFLNGNFSERTNEGLIFLTEEDISSKEGLKSWWNRFLKKVIEQRKVRGISSNSQDIKKEFKSVASQVMVTMSLTSVHLPRMTKSPNDKVATLLLNKEQLEAVNSKKPWRIVKGPFGSGKSLILKNVAKKLYKESKNHDVCIVYVCFDAFSLLEAEVSGHFEELRNNCDNNNTELYSLNLKEFADDKGFEVEELLKGFGTPKLTIADLIRKIYDGADLSLIHI